MAETFRRGQRVRYTGTLAPMLTDAIGTVKRINRKGFVIVDFDGFPGGRAVYDINLKREG